MKRLHYILLVALVVAESACSKGDIDFSYSPEEPRCGQTVIFSNKSTKGDTDSKWEWKFGDGSTSTVKSPSKVYRQAGVYMITLTLDGKNYQKAAKEITVYDSIPTFTASEINIGTYSAVTFTALTYNPYSLPLSYEWKLPKDVVITDGDEYSNSITLYFTHPSENAEVTLNTTVGDKTTEKTIAYKVIETPAPSCIMATADGHLLRQRLYTGILTSPDTITPDDIQLTNVRQLIISDNILYIFELRSGAEGAIYAMDLNTGEIETVIRNAASVTDYVYSTGTISDGMLYFADIANQNIYRIPLSTRNAIFTDGKQQLYASESTLKGLASGVCGGIGVYNGITHIGSTQGIYRFRDSDIGSGNAPATTIITTEEAPLNLAIDPLAGKIYTVEGTKLMVRNIDGSYVNTLDDGIESSWALCVAGSLNYLVSADKDGVFYIPLVQTRNNTVVAEHKQLNNIAAITLTIDETKR